MPEVNRYSDFASFKGFSQQPPGIALLRNKAPHQSTRYRVYIPVGQYPQQFVWLIASLLFARFFVALLA